MDYACLHRAMPIGLGLSASRYALRPWYDVLRSTFWQRKGQPFWLGLVLCPTLEILIIYILKQ